MVFQDYELIPTDRVNRARGNTNPYSARRWAALGGYSTVYMGGVFMMAGSYLGTSSAVAPLNTPITSFAGLRSAGKNLFAVAGPTAFGVMLGVAAFGDWQEFKNLMFNRSVYKAEMTAVQRELL